eukprot:COSAG01_NODE_1092_length_11738_cov_18.025775_3_plen_96_part_00
MEVTRLASYRSHEQREPSRPLWPQHYIWCVWFSLVPSLLVSDGFSKVTWLDIAGPAVGPGTCGTCTACSLHLNIGLRPTRSSQTQSRLHSIRAGQ